MSSQKSLFVCLCVCEICPMSYDHLTSAFNADVRCELCDSVIHFRCMRPALRKLVKDKTNKNKIFECEVHM